MCRLVDVDVLLERLQTKIFQREKNGLVLSRGHLVCDRLLFIYFYLNMEL